jgi:nucleoside-diphosphate-sugar epimerase
MIRLVRRGFAPVPGPAGAFISSVSHDDAASAVVAALELPAGAYNVSDDGPVTHREYFDTLAAALSVQKAQAAADLGDVSLRIHRQTGRALRADFQS